MGDHSTWFHLLPGYENFEKWAEHYLARRPLINGPHPAEAISGAEKALGDLIGPSYFTLSHVLIALFTSTLIIIGALIYRARVTDKDGNLNIVPEKTVGLRNFYELILETTLEMASGVMGRKNAIKYFPLIGTLVFFILFNNLIGLVPGFMPPTDTLKTNFALSLLVFVMYHFWGVKEHGLAYFKDFAGPLPVLAPLMVPIEIISHIARPVSLALRLMGNMAADHKVVAAFLFLVPILVPLPFMVLGILVCIVQTLVFTLLTMVYIDLAVAEGEH